MHQNYHHLLCPKCNQVNHSSSDPCTRTSTPCTRVVEPCTRVVEPCVSESSSTSSICYTPATYCVEVIECDEPETFDDDDCTDVTISTTSTKSSSSSSSSSSTSSTTYTSTTSYADDCDEPEPEPVTRGCTCGSYIY